MYSFFDLFKLKLLFLFYLITVKGLLETEMSQIDHIEIIYFTKKKENINNITFLELKIKILK